MKRIRDGVVSIDFLDVGVDKLIIEFGDLEFDGHEMVGE